MLFITDSLNHHRLRIVILPNLATSSLNSISQTKVYMLFTFATYFVIKKCPVVYAIIFPTQVYILYLVQIFFYYCFQAFLFNKQTLQCLAIDNILLNPPTCYCSLSPFNYNPAGHVITGVFNIVENEDLRTLILKGPVFRKPRSFN